MDSTLNVRDLLAMHLMQGIREAGRRISTWQLVYINLKKLKKAQWHTNDKKEPD